jgi:hypothetical protein
MVDRSSWLWLIINYQKLTSLNRVLWTTNNYDAVKRQNFRPRNLAKWAATCYSDFANERLLSEPSRPGMLAT